MIDIRTAIEKFFNKPIQDEKAINEFILDIQKEMLKADVDVKFVFEFSNQLRENLKQKPNKYTLTKIIYEKLENILGKAYQPDYSPRKIMLIGLYGAGKTTTAAKLWNFFSKTVSTRVVSFDYERPAGREQLKKLVGNAFRESIDDEKAIWIIDTPGRDSTSPELIQNLIDLKKKYSPKDVFLVIGADTGKYAAKLVDAFKEVGITGIIITKMDGSGKGGGALIAAARSGVNITFIGYGEKIDAIKPFDPKEFISRMLRIINIKEIEKMKMELTGSEEFDFETFKNEMKTMQSLNISDILSSIGISNAKENAIKTEGFLKKLDTIINSMTPEERKNPDLLKQDSRIRRIAKGSGIPEIEVRQILNRFFQFRTAIKKIRADKRILNFLKNFKI